MNFKNSFLTNQNIGAVVEYIPSRIHTEKMTATIGERRDVRVQAGLES